MQSLVIKGQKRAETGAKNAAKLRKEGLIPCELYGGDENTHFQAPELDLHKLIYTDQFLLADLDIEGKSFRAILKDMQFHPVTDKLLHVDFQELTEGRKVMAEIPVRLTGFAVGVKDGGRLDLKLRKLRIKALPKNLIEQVELDVTNLGLGKTIKVRDIELDGIEILNAGGTPVAQVTIPRALRGGGGGGASEEEEGAAEGEEAAAESEE